MATAKADRKRPNASASFAGMRPAGMGRSRVRDMMASMSASYHMFSAPEAPAPIAIASSEARPITGWIGTGAASMPASAVNTTSDITRGLSSSK